MCMSMQANVKLNTNRMTGNWVDRVVEYTNVQVRQVYACANETNINIVQLIFVLSVSLSLSMLSFVSFLLLMPFICLPVLPFYYGRLFYTRNILTAEEFRLEIEKRTKRLEHRKQFDFGVAEIKTGPTITIHLSMDSLFLYQAYVRELVNRSFIRIIFLKYPLFLFEFVLSAHS